MKIGIAMMSHETNTFSPVITDPTGIAGRGEPLRGEAALRLTAYCVLSLAAIFRLQKNNRLTSKWASLRRTAQRPGRERRPTNTCALPSVELAGRVDALSLLDLHGAMTTKSLRRRRGRDTATTYSLENPANSPSPYPWTCTPTPLPKRMAATATVTATGLPHLPSHRHGTAIRQCAARTAFFAMLQGGKFSRCCAGATRSQAAPL